jgi:hypothetical protein
LLFIQKLKNEIGSKSPAYPHGYFWVSRPPIRKSSRTNPLEAVCADVFLWFPCTEFSWHPMLSNGVPCAFGGFDHKVIKNGIAGPRKAVRSDGVHAMIGQDYYCKTCSKNFNSFDENFRAYLPLEIRAQFPFSSAGLVYSRKLARSIISSIYLNVIFSKYLGKQLSFHFD